VRARRTNLMRQHCGRLTIRQRAANYHAHDGQIAATPELPKFFGKRRRFFTRPSVKLSPRLWRFIGRSDSIGACIRFRFTCTIDIHRPQRLAPAPTPFTHSGDIDGTPFTPLTARPQRMLQRC
jgi:hypothetical protein